MKLEVLKWFTEAIIEFLKKTLEIILRVILFFLPLGIFLTLLQFRSKVSKVSNLSIYTDVNSVWQHIFPGFILVAIDPEQFKKEIKNRNTALQKWVEENKYTIAMVFMATLVAIMVIKG